MVFSHQTGIKLVSTVTRDRVGVPVGRVISRTGVVQLPHFEGLVIIILRGGVTVSTRVIRVHPMD